MRDRFYARAKADALTQDASAAWLTYGEAAYQDGWFAEAVVQSPDRYATFTADKRAHQEGGVTLVE